MIIIAILLPPLACYAASGRMLPALINLPFFALALLSAVSPKDPPMMTAFVWGLCTLHAFVLQYRSAKRLREMREEAERLRAEAEAERRHQEMLKVLQSRP